MPVPDVIRRILILGGTGEARALAMQLDQARPDLPPFDLVTSLAGRTREALALPGRLRVGGFGGADGLSAYLLSGKIDIVVDATHPFAATISASAAAACTAMGIPRLTLVRPAWQRQSGDNWIDAEDAKQAAAILPDVGRRVFLSTGRRDLPAFAMLEELWFLVRLVDRPTAPLPLHRYALVTGRGPFAWEAERNLLEVHNIDVLVCKASGGEATEPKLAAARALGLPVVMIRRPPPPPGPGIDSVAKAIEALRALLDAPTCRNDTLVP